MIRLAIICLLLTACQGHWVQWPPPVHIRPHVAVPTVAVDAPSLPTITPDPRTVTP